jgi:hypothetical protein
VPKYLATVLYRPSWTYSPPVEASTQGLNVKLIRYETFDQKIVWLTGELQTKFVFVPHQINLIFKRVLSNQNNFDIGTLESIK